ncbi:hypothetical protein LSM04_007224 [Trypanosoma melophagium]|uniref:uncharacterized protein n=1 Tax=Trypanosoma melophagium TaxID=715481 RepID=UPI00351A463F|nr:hypothetical protein LSM04_007224 [Trypanosoma melophagium]
MEGCFGTKGSRNDATTQPRGHHEKATPTPLKFYTRSLGAENGGFLTFIRIIATVFYAGTGEFPVTNARRPHANRPSGGQRAPRSFQGSFFLQVRLCAAVVSVVGLGVLFTALWAKSAVLIRTGRRHGDFHLAAPSCFFSIVYWGRHLGTSGFLGRGAQSSKLRRGLAPMRWRDKTDSPSWHDPGFLLVSFHSPAMLAWGVSDLKLPCLMASFWQRHGARNPFIQALRLHQSLFNHRIAYFILMDAEVSECKCRTSEPLSLLCGLGKKRTELMKHKVPFACSCSIF